jgi:Icc-related predicted phosphoesterase
MNLLCLTDIHNRLQPFGRILEDAGSADLVLLGGDLTNFGEPEDAEHLVHLAQSKNSPVVAVAGNCDSAAIDRRLVELGVSVAASGMIIGGVGIHGISAAPPWLPHMYHFTEDRLAADLKAGHSQIQNARRHVVLSHVPPMGCKLDRTHFFQHAGSSALREFIEAKQPALVVCGHIHEARGVEAIGAATIVNCGAAAAGYYAMAELDDHGRVKVDLRRC